MASTSAFFGRTPAFDKSTYDLGGLTESTSSRERQNPASHHHYSNTGTCHTQQTSCFPNSRLYLWERTPAQNTQPVNLKPAALLPIVEVLPDVAFAAASTMQALPAHQTEAIIHLAATFTCGSGGQGHRLTLQARIGNTYLAPQEGSGQLVVPCTIVKVNSTDPSEGLALPPDTTCLKANIAAALNMRGSLHWCSMYAATASIAWRQDCTARISGSLMFTGSQVALTQLSMKRVVDTPLARQLVTPARQGALPETGFLTLDSGRSLVVLSADDSQVFSVPLVGVWVRGISSPHHPSVLSSCLRFVFSATLLDKAVTEDGSFLVALYPQGGCSAPVCYEAHVLDEPQQQQAGGAAAGGRLPLLQYKYSGELLHLSQAAVLHQVQPRQNQQHMLRGHATANGDAFAAPQRVGDAVQLLLTPDDTARHVSLVSPSRSLVTGQQQLQQQQQQQSQRAMFGVNTSVNSMSLMSSRAPHAASRTAVVAQPKPPTKMQSLIPSQYVPGSTSGGVAMSDRIVTSSGQAGVHHHNCTPPRSATGTSAAPPTEASYTAAGSDAYGAGYGVSTSSLHTRTTSSTMHTSGGSLKYAAAAIRSSIDSMAPADVLSATHQLYGFSGSEEMTSRAVKSPHHHAPASMFSSPLPFVQDLAQQQLQPSQLHVLQQPIHVGYALATPHTSQRPSLLMAATLQHSHHHGHDPHHAAAAGSTAQGGDRVVVSSSSSYAQAIRICQGEPDTFQIHNHDNSTSHDIGDYAVPPGTQEGDVGAVMGDEGNIDDSDDESSPPPLPRSAAPPEPVTPSHAIHAGTHRNTAADTNTVAASNEAAARQRQQHSAGTAGQRHVQHHHHQQPPADPRLAMKREGHGRIAVSISSGLPVLQQCSSPIKSSPCRSSSTAGGYHSGYAATGGGGGGGGGLVAVPDPAATAAMRSVMSSFVFQPSLAASSMCLKPLYNPLLGSTHKAGGTASQGATAFNGRGSSQISGSNAACQPTATTAPSWRDRSMYSVAGDAAKPPGTWAAPNNTSAYVPGSTAAAIAPAVPAAHPALMQVSTTTTTDTVTAGGVQVHDVVVGHGGDTAAAAGGGTQSLQHQVVSLQQQVEMLQRQLASVLQQQQPGTSTRGLSLAVVKATNSRSHADADGNHDDGFHGPKAVLEDDPIIILHGDRERVDLCQYDHQHAATGHILQEPPSVGQHAYHNVRVQEPFSSNDNSPDMCTNKTGGWSHEHDVTHDHDDGRLYEQHHWQDNEHTSATASHNCNPQQAQQQGGQGGDGDAASAAAAPQATMVMMMQQRHSGVCVSSPPCTGGRSSSSGGSSSAAGRYAHLTAKELFGSDSSSSGGSSSSSVSNTPRNRRHTPSTTNTLTEATARAMTKVHTLAPTQRTNTGGGGGGGGSDVSSGTGGRRDATLTPTAYGAVYAPAAAPAPGDSVLIAGMAGTGGHHHHLSPPEFKSVTEHSHSLGTSVEPQPAHDGAGVVSAADGALTATDDVGGMSGGGGGTVTDVSGSRHVDRSEPSSAAGGSRTSFTTTYKPVTASGVKLTKTFYTPAAFNKSRRRSKVRLSDSDDDSGGNDSDHGRSHRHVAAAAGGSDDTDSDELEERLMRKYGIKR